MKRDAGIWQMVAISFLKKWEKVSQCRVDYFRNFPRNLVHLLISTMSF